MKKSQRVYVNTDGETGGNVSIILFEYGVAVVDAQYSVSGADFRRSISSVISKSLTHLLLTHYHGDHMFGNQAFEDCEIVAHHLLKEQMDKNLRIVWSLQIFKRTLEEVSTNRPERAWLFEKLRIVLPTTIFNEQFNLDRIKMIHTNGHTTDSSIVYMADDHVLFTGNLVFAEKFPWAGDSLSNPDM